MQSINLFQNDNSKENIAWISSTFIYGKTNSTGFRKRTQAYTHILGKRSHYPYHKLIKKDEEES